MEKRVKTFLSACKFSGDSLDSSCCWRQERKVLVLLMSPPVEVFQCRALGGRASPQASLRLQPQTEALDIRVVALALVARSPVPRDWLSHGRHTVLLCGASCAAAQTSIPAWQGRVTTAWRTSLALLRRSTLDWKGMVWRKLATILGIFVFRVLLALCTETRSSWQNVLITWAFGRIRNACGIH